MALEATSDKDSNLITRQFKNIIKHGKSDEAIKEDIYKMAKKMKDKLGNCSVMEGWVAGLEEEIQKKDNEIIQLLNDAQILKKISVFKFFERSVAKNLFEESNENDENYTSLKENFEICDKEYGISERNITYNNSEQYSTILDKFMKICDLGKLKRYINFFKQAISNIFRSVQ